MSNVAVMYSGDMSSYLILLAAALSSALLSACSSRSILPEALEPQIDKELTFVQLVASPESYQGKLVIVGGEVLKAKRLHTGTQLEVLRLPLKTESQGRLLALHLEFLDPATMADGTRVTIVGEVTGAKTDRLDDVHYRYPMLTFKHLHVWPAQVYGQRSSGPYWSIFGGMGSGGGSRGGGGFGLGY